jgi:hypothetical protein
MMEKIRRVPPKVKAVAVQHNVFFVASFSSVIVTAKPTLPGDGMLNEISI